MMSTRGRGRGRVASRTQVRSLLSFQAPNSQANTLNVVVWQMVGHRRELLYRVWGFNSSVCMMYSGVGKIDGAMRDTLTLTLVLNVRLLCTRETTLLKQHTRRRR